LNRGLKVAGLIVRGANDGNELHFYKDELGMMKDEVFE